MIREKKLKELLAERRRIDVALEEEYIQALADACKKDKLDSLVLDVDTTMTRDGLPVMGDEAPHVEELETWYLTKVSSMGVYLKWDPEKGAKKI